MASLAAAAWDVAARHVDAGRALSGIFGSISLTAWICLLLPQLWTNFKAKSADGLSLTFLVVWSLGDVTNLSGALLTNLAPSAVALAVYFCILDVTLISQCLYYNTLNDRLTAQKGTDDAAASTSENAPLLASRPRSPSATSTDSTPQAGERQDSATRPRRKSFPVEETTEKRAWWARNALSLLAVYAVGIAGWFVTYMAGAWGRDAPPAHGPPAGERHMSAMIGLALGYVSAVLYLCARVPQIVKNAREWSCQGLSLLFFMLSATGNMTYGLSLLAYSQDKQYLIRCIPWVLGSVGTVAEDAVIFIQFRLYGDGPRRAGVLEA